jgi:hypothetical protein
MTQVIRPSHCLADTMLTTVCGTHGSILDAEMPGRSSGLIRRMRATLPPGPEAPGAAGYWHADSDEYEAKRAEVIRLI